MDTPKSSKPLMPWKGPIRRLQGSGASPSKASEPGGFTLPHRSAARGLGRSLGRPCNAHVNGQRRSRQFRVQGLGHYALTPNPKPSTPKAYTKPLNPTPRNTETLSLSMTKSSIRGKTISAPYVNLRSVFGFKLPN